MIRTTLCMQCKHRQPKEERDGKLPVCAAFPTGIPFEIVVGELSHDHPIEGDHGIQYEPKEST